MRVVQILVLCLIAAAPAARAAEPPPVILVVGDSLSAGYGLVPGQGWVASARSSRVTPPSVVSPLTLALTTWYPYPSARSRLSSRLTHPALALIP